MQLKIKKNLHNKLKKYSADHPNGRKLFLLGKNRAGTIVDSVALRNGNIGCGWMPSVTVRTITDAYITLVKKGRKPCALAVIQYRGAKEVGNYSFHGLDLFRLKIPFLFYRTGEHIARQYNGSITESFVVETV
jgi:hypothetical protein